MSRVGLGGPAKIFVGFIRVIPGLVIRVIKIHSHVQAYPDVPWVRTVCRICAWFLVGSVVGLGCVAGCSGSVSSVLLMGPTLDSQPETPNSRQAPKP